VIYTDLNDGTFIDKAKPAASDWLAQHQEPGQTFSQYLRSKPNLPNKTRNVLYIQPDESGYEESDLCRESDS